MSEREHKACKVVELVGRESKFAEEDWRSTFWLDWTLITGVTRDSDRGDVDGA